jgi:hypothetical protein
VRFAARRPAEQLDGRRGEGAISNREQLATLRVKDDMLVLARMMRPDEIRRPGLRLPRGGRGRLAARARDAPSHAVARGPGASVMSTRRRVSRVDLIFQSDPCFS